jgi:hypothetical protein
MFKHNYNQVNKLFLLKIIFKDGQFRRIYFDERKIFFKKTVLIHLALHNLYVVNVHIVASRKQRSYLVIGGWSIFDENAQPKN